MYHVYLLRSINNPSKSYVGLTIRTPEDRLNEHNSGKSQFTKTDKPWRLIYYEKFYCKLCAEKREMFLKSGFGYRLRQVLLDNESKLI